MAGIRYYLGSFYFLSVSLKMNLLTKGVFVNSSTVLLLSITAGYIYIYIRKLQSVFAVKNRVSMSIVLVFWFYIYSQIARVGSLNRDEENLYNKHKICKRSLQP
jgi:hypothetical protein